MNLQEQISRIQSMMGVINENESTDFFYKNFDKLIDFFYKNFDKVFDELNLINTENHLHQYNWIDNNGKKVFQRNHWGMFWIYGCDKYYDLKIFPKMTGLSFIHFQKILIDYLNNKYKTQFGDEKPLKQIGNENCEEY